MDLNQLTRLAVTRRTALKGSILGAAVILAGRGTLGNLAGVGAQGAEGGSLIIGKPYELTGFDPAPEGSQTSWEIHAVVYESLVFLDGDLVPGPGLAEGWETPDDTTYVFKLRQGVKFHNGREMTSDDVVFSLQRVLELPTAWWDAMMGPAAPVPPAADASPVADGSPAAEATPVAVSTVGLSLEATDPYTVTARLTEPYAPFLQAMSATMVSIVPGAEVQSGEVDLERDLVGTGPFMLTEHSQDQRWIFSKFPDYWQEGKPKLDELVWQVMTDESARLAALRTGDIHLTMFENPKMLDLAEADPNIETIEQSTTNYYILFVNGKEPPLDDQRVRQAISLGIDREAIKDAALFGRATATGPIAAGFTKLAVPLSEVPFHTRDVDRAKSLLAEAGYGDGLKLTLLITQILAATVPMAELMKAQLAEIGIEVEIQQKDLGTFVDEYIVQGTSQMAISWWAGYSDPYLILVLLASRSLAPILGSIDAELDQIIVRAASETDPEARLQVLRDLENKIATMANFQPLVTRNNFIAYRKDLVGNVNLGAADGFGLPLWHHLEDMTLL